MLFRSENVPHTHGPVLSPAQPVEEHLPVWDSATDKALIAERDAEWEKAIQDEGDRIGWQGFGAETTFAKAVRARLFPPAVEKTAEERVTVHGRSGNSYWEVWLDGINQHTFDGHECKDAEIYALGLIAQLKAEAGRGVDAREGGKQ